MEQLVFGPFCLDVPGVRLLKDGVALELRPQVFHALKALLRNGGRYVDYPQMIQEAWDGTMVSRHTVAVTIGEAKKLLGEYGCYIQHRPKLGYRLDIPKTDDLIRKGWHFTKRFTREGFEKAIECFEQASLEDGARFGAYEGLSLCYLMLGAYAMRPGTEMYTKFKEAHARAVELTGMTPELRADRAHALHIFERRFAEAEAELLLAQTEDPKLVAAYGHLTTLYASSGRLEEALDTLSQAYRVDPLWPVLPAMEILVRIAQRDFDSAIRCGKNAVALHPFLHMGRFLYALALDLAGKNEEALAEYQLTRTISPDVPWLRAHEAACLIRCGRLDEALELYRELHWLRAAEYVDAYAMAVLAEALGRRDEAFRELDRAAAENSAVLFILDMDPKMDPLRGDPRFLRLRDQLFGRAGRSEAAC